jgi:phage-related protein
MVHIRAVRGGDDRPVLSVRLYRTSAGVEVVRDWLRDLAPEVRKQIGSDLLRVQWQWPVSLPLVRSFGEGLYELRSSHNKQEFRVFFVVEEQVLLALHGFQKKTQKTPPGELKTAQKRKKEVKS